MTLAVWFALVGAVLVGSLVSNVLAVLGAGLLARRRASRVLRPWRDVPDDDDAQGDDEIAIGDLPSFGPPETLLGFPRQTVEPAQELTIEVKLSDGGREFQPRRLRLSSLCGSRLRVIALEVAGVDVLKVADRRRGIPAAALDDPGLGTLHGTPWCGRGTVIGLRVLNASPAPVDCVATLFGSARDVPHPEVSTQ